MSETLRRLQKVISFSELKATKAIIVEIGAKKEIELVNSKVSDTVGVSRSILVNALKLLEVAGVVETQSLGARGTFIRVLDQSALKQISDF